MNYTKPEVAVLGQAVRVIENRNIQPKGQPLFTDALGLKAVTAAYDLDE